MTEPTTHHQRIVTHGEPDSLGRVSHTRLWCTPDPPIGHPFPELAKCKVCGGYEHGQVFHSLLPEPNSTGRTGLIRELLRNWDESKERWVQCYGNEDGFVDWWNGQLGIPTQATAE